MLFEFSLSGKWLELLKEIAPGVTRTVVVAEIEWLAGVLTMILIDA
jgi:hypothetical protein